MIDRAAMEAELAAVLADPTFLRSPVLARLLSYLVETTLAGGAQHLKSFSVAVDGLGRSPDLDPQVDTYARVQVARLRKALDGYYAAAGADRAQRLTIDSGSYDVRLSENGYSSVAKPARRPFPRRGLVPALIALCVVIAVAAGAAAMIRMRSDARAAQQRWQTNNFPSVTIEVTDRSNPSSPYVDPIRQELLMRIDRYQGIKVFYANSKEATYTVKVVLQRSAGGLLANTFVVDRRNNRIAWSGSGAVAIDPTDPYFRESDYISRTAFSIANGSGTIHSSERRRNYRVDTPYGCWLRFTQQTQRNRISADPVLAECAAQWHDAQPDLSMPAGLLAWTLLDQSIVAITDSGREELIEKAVNTLEAARALNANSGFLPAVAVRAYAIADEDPAMRTAAEQALKLNPGNLEIEGLVGTMLTLRNDPRGEAIIDNAIALRADPPAWYFIAKFTAAMMRDDVPGAGHALERLRHLSHTIPVVPIFTAAYEARTGRIDEARASWESAKRMQPLLRIDPESFFGRTPLSPEVVARLRQWLAPVLK